MTYNKNDMTKFKKGRKFIIIICRAFKMFKSHFFYQYRYAQYEEISF